MPLEPLRLDLAGGHLPRENDLEGALAETDSGYVGGVDGSHAEVVVSHAVEPVAAPVELFLEGDHPFADLTGASIRRPQRAGRRQTKSEQ